MVVPVSNVRVRTYFGFEPTELVDDIAVAVSHYANDGIESLLVIMDDLGLSAKQKERIEQHLILLIQRSLNINADKLERYLMRNIFTIPIDVDLAAAIQIPDQAEEDDEPPKIDVESEEDLTQLYAEIEEAINERKRLVQRVTEIESQVLIASALAERIPSIRSIIKTASLLPKEEIEELQNRLSAILETADSEAENPPDMAAMLLRDKERFIF